MSIDGRKTKINYADNLHVCSSSRSLKGSGYTVYYYSDGAFSIDSNRSGLRSISYNPYQAGGDSYIDAMAPKICMPLFMAANGYVYQACNDSLSREEIYKRFNTNGQLEECDWVPSETQEFGFSSNELLFKKDNAEYYFTLFTNDHFNGDFYGGTSLTTTVSDFQLVNSNGDPATVKKYDFSTSSFTSEDVSVVLSSSSLSWCYSSFNVRKDNVIYKVEYSDSSRNQFEITEIPLAGFTSSDGYSNYAATSQHLFFVKDGDLIAYNIEDGTKDLTCSKSDAIYGSVSAGSSPNEVFFTATSLSSNASISGTIDDNGNVTQNSTNYEIRYLSPIN